MRLELVGMLGNCRLLCFNVNWFTNAVFNQEPSEDDTGRVNGTGVQN
jgi:hypothetical protein